MICPEGPKHRPMETKASPSNCLLGLVQLAQQFLLFQALGVLVTVLAGGLRTIFCRGIFQTCRESGCVDRPADY